MEIAKVAFDSSDCDGDASVPCVTWQQYYGFRNAILKALRPLGSVGPMGECLIADEGDGPPGPWPVECDEPDFFVVDDWYNDWEFFIRIETHSRRISKEFIHALVSVLSAMPRRWAAGIDVGDGYLLLYADRLMTDGPRFEHCDSMGDVIAACT